MTYVALGSAVTEITVLGTNEITLRKWMGTTAIHPKRDRVIDFKATLKTLELSRLIHSNNRLLGY
jgi:hypothetical protein